MGESPEGATMRAAKGCFAVLLLSGFAMSFCAGWAQTNSFCQAHADTIYCKIQSLFGTPVVNPLQPLDQALATQLTLVPLASPASGIVYTANPATKLPVRSGTETFGPVLTERGETLYMKKLFVAGVYQRFRFNSLDGVNLKEIPMLFQFCNDSGQCGPIAVIVRVDLHLDQYAVFATYGVTNWMDVSVAMPILKVSMGAGGVRCVEPYCSFQSPDGSKTEFQNAAVQDSATGIGDIILRAKASIFEDGKFKFAVGVDVRVPSGDALNFLGAGGTGVKPFEALSRSGKISPHLNVAYQWNGDSVLAGPGNGQKGKLPEVLSWAAGADVAAMRDLTVSADYLGEHVLSASRLKLVTTDGIPNTVASAGTFDTVRGAIGLKWKPVKDLLITGNVLAKFDHNGLRHEVVPLAGISYTF
jgi:Putative MetA-pathway of phenol degradation